MLSPPPPVAGLTLNKSDASKATAVTISSSYSDEEFEATDYSALVTITAAKRTTPISIIGNAKNNKIFGGTGSDTLNGSEGNDTLTGGKGQNVFVYSDGGGNDVIADYKVGQDVVQLVSGTVDSFSVKGKDATLKIGAGSIKVKNLGNETVTVVDANGNTESYSMIPKGLVFNNKNDLTKATTVTISSDFEGALETKPYKNLVTIDASNRDESVEIVGNTKNNKIFGTTDDDILNGGAKGNDTVHGNEGDDSIDGGKGNDRLFGDDGEDTINGGKGNDTLYGGADGDSISGDDGNDRIFGDDGEDTINGGKGNDTLYGGADGDSINGDDGNDKIFGEEGDDTISGGKGNDTLSGGDGENVFIFNSSEGKDIITDFVGSKDVIHLESGTVSRYSVSGGKDAILKIGSGTVTLKNLGNEKITVVGADGDSTVYGLADGLEFNKSDLPKATAVNITSDYEPDNFVATTYANLVTVNASTREESIEITGNAKNNKIFGSAGDDVLNGGTKGNDSIHGGEGDDSIFGEVGNDKIFGDDGDDTLSGGAGNDTLTGGDGADVFIYVSGGGNDVITDYASNEDIIQLESGSVSSYSVKNGNAILKIGSGNVTLKGVGNNMITVVGASGDSSVYGTGGDDTMPPDDTIPADTDTVASGLVFNDAKTAVTITADYEENIFNVADYSSLVSIDATNHGDISIRGNDSTKLKVIKTGKGKDSVYTFNDNVSVSTGVGNDYVQHNGKYSTINAGEGSDRISISGGDHVVVYGGAGKDKFDYLYSSTSGNNFTLYGGDGDDDFANTLGSYSVGNSLVDGGAGNDFIEGSYATINAGEGDDKVHILNFDGSEGLIIGGTGNDAITLGGSGNNLIRYSSGDGNDTIVGFKNNDTLQIMLGDYTTLFSGDDFALKVGDNSIILKDTSNFTSVNVADSLGNVNVIDLNTSPETDATVTSGLNFDNDDLSQAFAVTITSDYTPNKFNATGYENLENIEVSTHGAISIKGNDNMNYIVGGTGNDTVLGEGGNDLIFGGNGNDAIHGNEDDDVLYGEVGNDLLYGDEGKDMLYGDDGNDTLIGGTDNDTLTGGKGNDVFYYSSGDGTDVVRDYTENQDRIHFNVASVNNGTLVGSDVIFTIGSGSVTLEKVKSKEVVIDFSDDTKQKYFNGIPIFDPTVVLGIGAQGTFSLSSYNDTATISAVNIDATNCTNGLEIYGDDKANIVWAGNELDNIIGGKGDDTLYSGSSGYTRFIYAKGDGSDTIYNVKGDYYYYYNCDYIEHGRKCIGYRRHDLFES